MRGDRVVDASVLGAAFFNETASRSARVWLGEDLRLIAPDLLCIELASIAAKKVWRGEASAEVGEKAVASVRDFVSELAPMDDLAGRAFALAAAHRFSAYDAAYLALAETRGVQMVTLDHRLADRAEAVGLGALVERLTG